MAFLIVILMLRHNLYFLRRVYQRRRAIRNKIDPFIVIDINDKDCHFGFGRANHAFNVQVGLLALAGALLLASRFHNVTAAQSKPLYGVLPALLSLFKLDLKDVDKLAALGGTLPDVGQYILVFSWLLLLGIVSVPALVKFLPFRTKRGLDIDRTAYLEEFLPESAWPATTDKVFVDSLAAGFAANSFWPTGDNRAMWLYSLAFFVFLVMLFPLRPESGNMILFAAWYGVLCTLGYLTAACMLQCLRASLAFIDPTLVAKPPKKD